MSGYTEDHLVEQLWVAGEMRSADDCFSISPDGESSELVKNLDNFTKKANFTAL